MLSTVPRYGSKLAGSLSTRPYSMRFRQNTQGMRGQRLTEQERFYPLYFLRGGVLRV